MGPYADTVHAVHACTACFANLYYCRIRLVGALARPNGHSLKSLDR